MQILRRILPVGLPRCVKIMGLRGLELLKLHSRLTASLSLVPPPLFAP